MCTIFCRWQKVARAQPGNFHPSSYQISIDILRYCIYRFPLFPMISHKMKIPISINMYFDIATCGISEEFSGCQTPTAPCGVPMCLDRSIPLQMDARSPTDALWMTGFVIAQIVRMKCFLRARAACQAGAFFRTWSFLRSFPKPLKLGGSLETPLRHTNQSGISTGWGASCCSGCKRRCGGWPCSWLGFRSWSHGAFGSPGCLSRDHCFGIQWGPHRWKKSPNSRFNRNFREIPNTNHNLPHMIQECQLTWKRIVA